jgi:hypothetical protein
MQHYDHQTSDYIAIHCRYLLLDKFNTLLLLIQQYCDKQKQINKGSVQARTDRHDITEILLKVALNTITHPPTLFILSPVSLVEIGYRDPNLCQCCKACGRCLLSSSLNPANGWMYSIPLYVSDMRQVNGFLWILQFPSQTASI